MKINWPLLQILLVISLPFALMAKSEGGIVLSEVLADPSVVSDLKGEFIELMNTNSDTLRMDTLWIEIEGATFFIPRLVLAPKSFFVVCRNSIPLENGNMFCNYSWAGMSLSNNKVLSFLISANSEEPIHYSIPASVAGTSLENTMDSVGNFDVFLPSKATGAKGDVATPGRRNSRSLEVPRDDLGIFNVTYKNDGNVLVQIENRGQWHNLKSGLSINLDENWDGEADFRIDSISFPESLAKLTQFEIHLPSFAQGMVQFQLSEDDELENNFYQFAREDAPPLELSEWCPNPENNAPEWIEIRNATNDLSGNGRPISLRYVTFNGQPLGDKSGQLAPGAFLVLTSSLEAFQNFYGAIKVQVLKVSPWPGLRNTGDTLRIFSREYVLDSVIYTEKEANFEGCMAKGSWGQIANLGTPGYTVQPNDSFSWFVSSPILKPNNPLEVTVNAPSDYRYTLRVLDLEGNVVHVFSSGFPGRNTHFWNGKSDSGRILPSGAYLLCLNSDGHAIRKKAIVLASDR